MVIYKRLIEKELLRSRFLFLYQFVYLHLSLIMKIWATLLLSFY